MMRWFVLAGMSLLVPVAALALDDEIPSIEKVMQKLHKGSNSEQKALQKQVQASPTDWEAIGKITKDFVILGAALGKNDPPKGDKESWKKLTAEYLATAEDLDKAATDKNLDKLKAAQKKMGGSCKACHSVHQPKD